MNEPIGLGSDVVVTVEQIAEMLNLDMTSAGAIVDAIDDKRSK